LEVRGERQDGTKPGSDIDIIENGEMKKRLGDLETRRLRLRGKGVGSKQ
jgi:hypothetical protein